MPNLPQSSDNRRNRTGCFVILGIVAVAVALYLLAGFNAEPGNSSTEQIQTVPASR
jgi:hypothetical protein